VTKQNNHLSIYQHHTKKILSSIFTPMVRAGFSCLPLEIVAAIGPCPTW